MSAKRYLAFTAHDRWDMSLILWRERAIITLSSVTVGREKSLPALTKRVSGTERTFLIRMKQQEKSNDEAAMFGKQT